MIMSVVVEVEENKVKGENERKKIVKEEMS